MKQKLAITTVLTLATLSACVLGNEPGPDPEGSNYLNVRDAHKRQIQEKTHQEQQLTEASVMLHAAMSDGDIVANPFNDNGENPYVFVSEEARRAFYQLLDDAGLTVRISLATMQEIAQSPSGAEQSTSKSDQTDITDLVRRLVLVNNDLFPAQDDQHPKSAYTSLGSLVKKTRSQCDLAR